MKNTYSYQPETSAAVTRLYATCNGTVAADDMYHGVLHNEPLLVMADCLLRYAKAYAQRWEQPVSADGFLGEPFKEALFGVRALLNGNGAYAMESGRRESFDGGTLDHILCQAAEIGGFGHEL